MTTQIKTRYFLFSIMFFILLFACRTEDDLSIDPPTGETLKANSTTANLMARVATKDGSNDNIIDKASCLTVQLPVTVTVNGTKLIITDEDGYGDIKDIIDLNSNDVDTVVITFPITVIRTDFSTLMVNSDSELASLTANCIGENMPDADIECIDFQYPVTISYFNENNDSVKTITIKNDKELYAFIEDLNKFAAVTINFPVTVVFADGTIQTSNNVLDLENTIDMADNTCDEDDNNDFNEPCTTCSSNELKTALVACPEWKVEKLKRNDNYLVKKDDEYLFKFNNDGTLTVVQKTNTFNGTWLTSGTGANIKLVINVTGQSDFNDTWDLLKLDLKKKDQKIELRIGKDRLHFKSDCM